MTTKTIQYRTRTAMKADKILQGVIGFRSIHTDFKNNDENQGFIVTYDDKIQVKIPNRKLTQTAFIRELALNSNIDLI